MPTTTTRRAFSRVALADPADIVTSIATFIDQVDTQMGSVIQGVLASRPTTGKDGDMYFARDDKTMGENGTLWIWDSSGAAWRLPGQRQYPGDLKHSLQTADHTGWLFCDGRSMLRTDYPNLFAVIGTTFGAVDGTHFTLPDYQGRFLSGKGTHADVNAFTDNDGLALANRTPKHQHFTPWPFAENGGAGNFVGAIKNGAAALAAMGYSLRDRITDNSVTEKTTPVGKLSNASANGDATSAAANAGNMFNGSPYNDVAAYRDVGSTLVGPAYSVANIFVKT